MKVAIYCRLSEEDKNKPDMKDSESIQNQKSMLVQYATEMQWEIFGIYSDDDYTGADRKRPEYNKLLADAENRKFDIVLCKTQSRFTRELEMVEKYIHGLFPLWGIRFISIVDNADTDNKGNKKSRQINGLINEWYLEDLSDNIRSVLKSKRDQGHYMGTTALYGYKKNPQKKGHLIIDEVSAEIVREVFNLFNQGYEKAEIALMLNERKVPTPSEYRQLSAENEEKAPKNKTAQLWRYPTIAKMLTNIMYIGHMVQGRSGSICYKSKQVKLKPREEWSIVKDTHEAIIDQELWESVQLKIKSRYRPFDTTTVGMFAKKVRCATCGYVMRSGVSRGVKYFNCRTKQISKDACTGAHTNINKLTSFIINELEIFRKEYLDKDKVYANVEFNSNQEDKQKLLLTQIGSYEKKSNEYTKVINEAYFDKVKGLIDEEDFVAITKEAREQKAMYLRLLDEVKNKLDSLEQQKSNLVDKKQVIEEILNTRELNKVIVDALIDHIKVGKNDRKTNIQSIEIHWNF
ncbi:MAG: recombinase family protein [Defluviitaleaceae bacterium]|nr:recombinase family protein [Defluviitaleaceae bacterium]